jgi:NAD(P)H-hydrate epimerase
MSQPIFLNREQSRQVDRMAVEEFGFSGLVLMENAGRGTADVLCRLGIGGPVVVCCGKGNNAGDGFVIARHLDLRGHAVRVLIWANPEEFLGDAAVNFQILTKTDVPIEFFDDSSRHTPRAEAKSSQHTPCADTAGGTRSVPATVTDGTRSVPASVERLEKALDGAAWIVDALLGTGASGEPRPPLDAVIDQLNAAAAPKLAVDLPSGLDCDTGRAARHTIRAAETCTFVAAKPGFFTPEAAAYVGRLHVLDIGVPRKLIERAASVPSPFGRGLG